MAVPIHTDIICSCFLTAMVEMNSCNRDLVAYKH